MALNAAQKKEVDALKDLLAAKELEIRQDYPATFASNGNMFFDLFKGLKEQVERIEKA